MECATLSREWWRQVARLNKKRKIYYKVYWQARQVLKLKIWNRIGTKYLNTTIYGQYIHPCKQRVSGSNPLIYTSSIIGIQQTRYVVCLFLFNSIIYKKIGTKLALNRLGLKA